MLNLQFVSNLASRLPGMHGGGFSAPRRTIVIRIAVVFVALGILYLRMPGSFLHPQLYGEDNDFLYKTRADGWVSVFHVIAGWLAVAQFLVAMAASYVSVALAPAIYNYAAFALTLLVVWMVMSPRLDMPFKPLLAIAIVVVPMGHEEIGTLTNIQWILPIGAFALLFMSPSKSMIVLFGEALFLTVTSLSGPFAIFYTPLYVWRLLTTSGSAERRRILLLTAIVVIGALVQVWILYQNPSVLNLVPPTAYPWTVWINLPFTQFMTSFGFTKGRFQGNGDAALAISLFIIAAALAWLPSFRLQKIYMLLFSFAIALAGMFKFRAALETQFASQRYFYVGCVLVLWFICCVTDRRYLRLALATFVTLVELRLLPLIANTPRFTDDQEWPVWSTYLTSGLPVVIPTTPAGFYLSLPETPDGPLSKYRSWMGRDIAEVSGRKDASACVGTLGLVQSADMIYLQPVRRSEELWLTRGTAWNAKHDSPVQLIAIVEAGDRVIGFGWPGFQQQGESRLARMRSGWKSVFYAQPGTTIRAYGVIDEGRMVCPLANQRYFPSVARPLGSNQFVEALQIVPNRDIVQRFKPTQRVEAISVQLVTFGQNPSPYKVNWQIVGFSRGNAIKLGAGDIDTSIIRDWQNVSLPILNVSEDVLDQVEVSFRAEAAANPSAPIGIPLYRPTSDDAVPAAEVGTISVESGAVLAITASFAE